MNIDHICIAVKSIDKAAEKFCQVFDYSIYTDVVENTRQQVNVQFLRKEGSLEIKLIEPSNRESPLISFLKKGEGLHHICFKTDELGSTMESLDQHGLRVLSSPKPGEAFDNELIAFLYAGHGLNFEVIETTKRKLVKPD